ncbi:uncharacterized protein [Nicotiana tomentosiformis]|uniref:uncharacterized protein n=1 Tax=Nicotiana tomentosiformis TaxID=4098 RepID=UPI00388C5847
MGLKYLKRPVGSLQQGMQPSIERGRGRTAASSSSGQQNRIYALSGQHNIESSPDVVICILFVFSINVYALIDPGSTLSYITPFVAGKCDKEPKLLRQLYEVSMPIGESVIVRRVYQGCDMMIYDHHTLSDLNELEMVEFDVIMGMYWLASCYTNVDCLKNVVRFNFQESPLLNGRVTLQYLRETIFLALRLER